MLKYPNNLLKIEFINRDGELPQMPKRKRKGDAAFDLYAPKDITIKNGEVNKIPLGIKIQTPEGYYAETRERSGHAIKYGLITIGNVIDQNYRGEIHAIIISLFVDPIEFKQGDRIAQLLVLPYFTANPMEAEVDDTERGEDGLGSTGNK